MPYKNKKDKKKQNKQYYLENKDKLIEYAKQWKKDNPEKVRKSKRKWRKNKRKTDLRFNLTYRILKAISKSLKGNKNGRHWETIVGYTLGDLIKRLKKTMPKGYNWQDFLNGRLHIDHIIPKSVFNFTKPEHPDFKRCWDLSNLQLLPAKENIIKSNKLTKPFQPALKI